MLVLAVCQQRAVRLQADSGLLHGMQQHPMQIGAVHRGVRCTVTCCYDSAETQRAQQAAGQRASYLELLRKSGNLGQRFFQTPAVQHLDDVRAQLDASARFAEDRRPLKKLDIPPRARGSQSCGHPTDSAASDQDARVFKHFDSRPARPKNNFSCSAAKRNSQRLAGIHVASNWRSTYGKMPPLR